MIETIQPPQPLLGLLTPKIVVPVLEEALLAEAVALPFPVTYMIPPPVVDLVMEAEISDHQGPRQTDMKTHLMDDSLEVRGRTEVKQPLKGIVFYVLLIFAKRKEKKKKKYHAGGRRFVQFHEISFLMYAAVMMHTAKFWLIKCILCINVRSGVSADLIIHA